MIPPEHFQEVFHTVAMSTHTTKRELRSVLKLNKTTLNSYLRFGVPTSKQFTVMNKLKVYLFDNLSNKTGCDPIGKVKEETTTDTLTSEDYKEAELNGIKYSVLYERFYRYGWTKDDAITKPVKKRVKRIKEVYLFENLGGKKNDKVRERQSV
jgi:hypothetical protein